MLILGATPIGNLGDASPRLRDALDGATTIASEDTRVTQRLLVALGVTNRPRLIALHEHNERQRAADIVELARESDVLVLSDAGMPTVSDPGFPLVTHAVEAGVRVTVLPGPSAVTTALALSGLPTNRLAFVGFLRSSLAHRGDSHRDGDGVWARPPRGGVSRTHEAPRGSAAGFTRRACRVGGGRCER